MTLLVVIIGLTMFGLLMVYDSSIASALQNFGDKYYFIKQQVIWVILGLAGMVFMSFFD
jgi:cell division protein FtsW (lipid II flippase)